jgi:hypothetical protein
VVCYLIRSYHLVNTNLIDNCCRSCQFIPQNRYYIGFCLCIHYFFYYNKHFINYLSYFIVFYLYLLPSFSNWLLSFPHFLPIDLILNRDIISCLTLFIEYYLILFHFTISHFNHQHPTKLVHLKEVDSFLLTLLFTYCSSHSSLYLLYLYSSLSD